MENGPSWGYPAPGFVINFATDLTIYFPKRFQTYFAIHSLVYNGYPDEYVISNVLTIEDMKRMIDEFVECEHNH